MLSEHLISIPKAEYKLMQQKIEQSQSAVNTLEKRLHGLADNVPGMIYQFCLNPDGTMSIPYVSSGCQQIYELKPHCIQQDSQVIGSMVHPDDIALLEQTVLESAQTLQKWELEWRIKTPSGVEKWLQGLSQPELQADNSIVWYGCIIDITQRKQTEIELAQINEKLEANIQEKTLELQLSQERLQRLADKVPGMLYEYRLDAQGVGSFPYVSSGSRLIYEVEPNLIQQDVELVNRQIHPEDFIKVQEAVLKSAQTLEPWESSWRITTPSGKEKWIQGISKPILEKDGSTIWYGCFIDITKRQQIETELRQKEAQYRNIFEAVSDGLIVNDLETGIVVAANATAYKIYGYSKEEFIGIHPTKFIHPSEHTKFGNFLKIVSAGESFHEESITLHQNGSKVYIDVKGSQCIYNGRPYALAIIRDISQRKLAEEKIHQQTKTLQLALHKIKNTQAKLVQSEKMSSLGQMVAGVAHEINNPVNFIHGNLKPACEYVQDLLRLLALYQQYYPQPEPEIQAEIETIELDFIQEDLIKILKSMQEGTTRIREIVLSLRNFSRLDEADFKKANIHEGIDSTLMILNNRLKAKPGSPEIQIVKEYDTSLPAIDCYAGQLNQVFMNILVNSIDALEDKIKKNQKNENNLNSQITINTKFLRSKFVKITISDNADGIPLSIQNKLFDPFFTTKEVGKGTGLGLSISYQIVVEKHRGKLYCYSKPGEGTEFVIEIPAYQ